MFRKTFFCLSLLCSIQSAAFEVSENAWAAGHTTFFVAIPGIAPSGETWQAAFTRAMDAWTNQTAFSFDTIDSFANPCTGQQTDDLGDGLGGAGFANTSCGTAFGENVLAITLNTLSCENAACTGPKEIIESDIVFNNTLQWDIYSGPLQLPVQDFERVALHELGHVLGLNHEFTSDAIMQPFASDLNTLQQDDINGANYIYNGISTTDSIYGIAIQLPSVQEFNDSQNSSSFAGALSDTDANLDDKFVDVFQVHFVNDSLVTVGMQSSDFDAALILARIDSTQQIISEQFFEDNNSGDGTNAEISQVVPAGTYWIGATSAVNQQQGSYIINTNASNSSGTSDVQTFTSVYGPEVEVNPNPQIAAALDSTDSQHENRYIDIYQFDVSEAVELRIDARSGDFDTKLMLVDVLPSQAFGDVFLENDDNGAGTNSTIQTQLQPGTYWMAVTSFFPNTTGDYNILVSVVVP